MALVFTQSRRAVVGDRKIVEGTVSFTGATSYATGGIAIAASDVGLVSLESVEPLGSVGGGVTVISNAAGTAPSKLLLTSAAGTSITEIANAGDPTAVKIQLRARGY